ncbi:MAG: hypothetical protein JW759_05385 [Candidatus Coatesbacteria bacterium]|nr:hypothetical protein [Candidatus Coatesbacteria bacterium]
MKRSLLIVAFATWLGKVRPLLGRLELLENWRLKLCAGFLALFLWMLAASGYKENIRMPVELKLEGLKAGLLILEQSVDKLDVTIRGASRVISELTADQITASHSLSDVTSPKELTVRILPEEIASPPGTTVISVTPSSVRVIIGKKTTVSVPVNLEIKGKPAPDFEIVGETSEPKTVQLQGPESVLADVTSVKTEAVNVEGVTEPFAGRAYLIPIHPLVSFVDSKSVLVRIDIQERMRTRKFLSVPIQQIPPERAVAIVPPRIKVDISGPVSVVTAIASEELIGVVDVMDLGKGKYLRTPRFRLPAGTSVKSRDPDQVTIIIKSDDVGGE